MFCHRRGVPLSQKFVRNLAVKAFPKENTFGKAWFRGFRKRHQDLLMFQSQRSMSSGRRNPTTYEQTLMFTKVFQEVLEDFKVHSWPVHEFALVNFDETLRVGSTKGKETLELIPRGEATGSEQLPAGVIGALLTFVTANGSVPLLVVCMKHSSPKTCRVVAPTFNVT